MVPERWGKIARPIAIPVTCHVDAPITHRPRHLCQQSAPIISITSRETGEPRLWVGDHADTRTCRTLSAEHIPAGSTRLYIDEWQSHRGSHPAHATVCHSVHEWGQDDDGDGRRGVYGNTREGAGAALRTYVRAFRGVHKQYLHLSVATYEAMVKAKRITPDLIHRMCLGNLSGHTGYT
jgi:hypothetical protein